MNVPWLNRGRHEGEARQADAATAVTQAELEARESAVFLEIRQAQIEVLAAQRRVRLYRDTLLPQAEAAFKASTAAYQNNRADFLNLIDSQNLLLDIQTAYYKSSCGNGCGSCATGARYWRATYRGNRQREDRQMTVKEKKLFALGAGVGVLVAALVVWAVAARDSRSFASAAIMPAAAQPQTAQGSRVESRPRHAARHAAGYAAGDYGRAISCGDYGGWCAGGGGAHCDVEDRHRRIWPRRAARDSVGCGKRLDWRTYRQAICAIHRRTGAARAADRRVV